MHLGARDLVVVTNRPDVDVRGVTLSVFVSDPSRSQIDGRAPSSTHHYVELAPGGGGTFRLPELDVVVESSVLACVSIKAWLAGLSNQIDGLYYSVLDDRYALVSYCTSATGPDYASAAPRFGQNRVDRFDAFETALGRPIVVRLNDRPLPAPSTELR